MPTERMLVTILALGICLYLLMAVSWVSWWLGCIGLVVLAGSAAWLAWRLMR